MIEEIKNTIIDFFENSQKYECINEAKCSIGGQKLNSLPMIRSCEARCILNEAVDWETEQYKRGGIIVFSTDVNAVELDSNRIKNWVKQKVVTLKNRVNYKDIVDKVAHSNELVGWTIGKYLNCRYRAKNGKTFSENSLSLEIIGVDKNKMIKIAEEICREFQQECVLLKDYSTGDILFINPK